MGLVASPATPSTLAVLGLASWSYQRMARLTWAGVGTLYPVLLGSLNQFTTIRAPASATNRACWALSWFSAIWLSVWASIR